MQDRFGRKLQTLRLSVTDRCNLRCRYCMPETGVQWVPREQVLSLEEMERLARLLVAQGIRRIKITGGEPLLRPGIVQLIENLASIRGLEELSMITNGLLLERFAQPLKDAGLNRLTVSLDSLDEEKFKAITRGGELKRVFAGLEAARKAGLGPLKINCVMLRDNEQELLQIAALAVEQPWDVRFIEYMPVTSAVDDAMAPAVTPMQLREKLEKRWGSLRPDDHNPSAPARVFRFSGGLGRIGFISSVSEPFCASCDRLRLGADGFLKLCMAQPDGVDLMPPLRAGESDRQLKTRIRKAAWNKPAGHEFYSKEVPQGQMMSRMGG